MSATSLSEPEDERLSPLERWTRLLGGGWIFVLLIALIAIFTTLRPEQFGSGFNLSMLAINAAILLVLSVGQTFVIIAGGIDLSVGTVLVFASIASAQIMLRMSGSAGGTYGTTQGGWGVVFVGLIVALASGALWGAINGILVAAARIPRSLSRSAPSAWRWALHKSSRTAPTSGPSRRSSSTQSDPGPLPAFPSLS
jgi:ribose transport system permease protein